MLASTRRRIGISVKWKETWTWRTGIYVLRSVKTSENMASGTSSETIGCPQKLFLNFAILWTIAAKWCIDTSQKISNYMKTIHKNRQHYLDLHYSIYNGEIGQKWYLVIIFDPPLSLFTKGFVCLSDDPCTMHSAHLRGSNCNFQRHNWTFELSAAVGQRLMWTRS